MMIKVIMPVAFSNRVEQLKAHVRRKHKKDKRIPTVSVISLYKSKNPLTLTRGNMVYIANSAPKLITSKDTIYLLSVDNPILMGLLCARITHRMDVLFTRSKRRWFLLEYDEKSRMFQEYFLP